jgi:hypothetical protein
MHFAKMFILVGYMDPPILLGAQESPSFVVISDSFLQCLCTSKRSRLFIVLFYLNYLPINFNLYQKVLGQLRLRKSVTFLILLQEIVYQTKGTQSLHFNLKQELRFGEFSF